MNAEGKRLMEHSPPPMKTETRLKLMRDKIEEYKRAGKGALAILRVPTSDAYPPNVLQAMKVLEESFDK